MTADLTPSITPSIRASRVRLPRSRGAFGGLLLMILGAWAALVPFIGPALDLAYTPNPRTAWHWTAARGLLEVLPGGAVVVGGLLLLFSRSRLVTSFGAWLAVAAGGWLIIGPAVATPAHIHLGTPDPSANSATQALAQLLFFFGIGALIVFVASVALGRLSVHSVRDVRAAARRAAEIEAAEAEQRRTIERELAQERATAERSGSHRSSEYRPVTNGHAPQETPSKPAAHQAYPPAPASGQPPPTSEASRR